MRGLTLASAPCLLPGVCWLWLWLSPDRPSVHGVPDSFLVGSPSCSRLRLALPGFVRTEIRQKGNNERKVKLEGTGV